MVLFVRIQEDGGASTPAPGHVWTVDAGRLAGRCQSPAIQAHCRPVQVRHRNHTLRWQYWRHMCCHCHCHSVCFPLYSHLVCVYDESAESAESAAAAAAAAVESVESVESAEFAESDESAESVAPAESAAPLFPCYLTAGFLRPRAPFRRRPPRPPPRPPPADLFLL